MAYNHSAAKAIFEAEWKKKTAEYRKHGMSEEKIASMREFEEEVFKSDRKFYEGLTDYILDEHSPDLWFNPQKVDKKKEKKYNRSKQASRKTSRRKNK